MAKEYKPYAQKLKDPRWQERRRQILERDESTCQLCGTTDGTLNVHHAHYITGREPWEYEDEYLKTLCEPCHLKWHDAQNRLLMAASCLIGHEQFEELVGFAKAFAGSFANSLDPPSIALANDMERRGAGYFGLLGALVFYKMDVSDPRLATTEGATHICDRNPHLQEALPADVFENKAIALVKKLASEL